MGRKPTKNLNLPAGMRVRKRRYGTYYYFDAGGEPRKEIALGSDYVTAVQKWAELTMSRSKIDQLITFRQVAELYIRDELPKKSRTTQSDNLRELPMLYAFFDNPPAPLDEIEPVHVNLYLAWRVRTTVQKLEEKNKQRAESGKEPLPVPPNAGHVRANREKALLSHIWNYARATGLTKLPNPCAGIKGHKESGRDVYVDDEVYNVVWTAAEDWLRDLLDLAYMLGQRPADTRKVTRADIKDGAVWVKQNKTNEKLRVIIEGELKDVLDRIEARNAAEPIPSIAATAKLFPKTYSEFRGAFDRARDRAVESRPDLKVKIREYQFRDLRAKAGTDTDEQHGLEAAQRQLGHTTAAMTRKYVRHRKGKLVRPTPVGKKVPQNDSN